MNITETITNPLALTVFIAVVGAIIFYTWLARKSEIEPKSLDDRDAIAPHPCDEGRCATLSESILPVNRDTGGQVPLVHVGYDPAEGKCRSVSLISDGNYHQEVSPEVDLYYEFSNMMHREFPPPFVNIKPKMFERWGLHKHVHAVGVTGTVTYWLRYREGHDALTSNPAWIAWSRLPGKQSLFGYRLFDEPGQGRKPISIVRQLSAVSWVNG